MTYFLYMLMKIIDGRMERRKVVSKSKGRQELHSGATFEAVVARKKMILSIFQSFVGRFGLSAAKPCLWWLQRWTSEVEGQEVKVTMLYSQSAKHPKPRLIQQYISTSAVRTKDSISSVPVFGGLGSPADVPIALPALAACCLTKSPTLKERVLEGVGKYQPL